MSWQMAVVENVYYYGKAEQYRLGDPVHPADDNLAISDAWLVGVIEKEACDLYIIESTNCCQRTARDFRAWVKAVCMNNFGLMESETAQIGQSRTGRNGRVSKVC